MRIFFLAVLSMLVGVSAFAQEGPIESNYICGVKVVGAENVSDKLFLKLRWTPSVGGHPGHASPSRKSIIFGTQVLQGVGERVPSGRVNTALENFVSDRINPTTFERWSGNFSDSYYEIESANFDENRPSNAYSLADFAKFEDDSNAGFGGPSGVRYEFAPVQTSSEYSMKFTQFKGGLADGKIDYELVGTCQLAK